MIHWQRDAASDHAIGCGAPHLSALASRSQEPVCCSPDPLKVDCLPCLLVMAREADRAADAAETIAIGRRVREIEAWARNRAEQDCNG